MTQRRWLALLGLITLGAAALRFSTLGLQSYAYDEVYTADFVLHHGLVETLRAVRHTESTPPLYYSLAWLWSKVFGTGEVGLRSLSALLGTALVPVTYAAATALTTRRVGIVAALLVAVNPAFVWYSQQARAYILLALLTAAGLYFFARALRGGGARALAGWALASAAALATHYFAAFVLVPEAVWLLVSVRGRAAWVAVAAVGAFGLALLPLAIDQQSAGHADYIGDIAFGKRFAQLPKLFLLGPQTGYGPLPALTIAAFGAGAFAVLRRAEPDERRAGAIWAALAAAAVVLPLIAAAGGVDFVFARNLLPAFVPVLLVLAATAGAARAGLAGLAAAGLLAAVWLACVVKTDLDPGWQRTDWRWVSGRIGPPASDRVIVVNALGEVPLGHYRRLDPAPARVRGVREIDYAGEMLDQLAASALPPGFRLVETGKEGKLRFRRYVSTAPAEIATARLTAHDSRFYGTPRARVDAPGGG